MFPTSLYRTLVSNASVAISFDTSATAETEVQVSFMITNNSSAKIGPMSLAIVDDDKNKAVRPEGSTDDLEIPFEIEVGGTNDFRFNLSVTSTGMAVKLGGALKYTSGSDEASLDFELPLPDSALVVPGTCSKEQFAELLGGSALTGKESAQIPTGGKPLVELLGKLTATLHLSVVEMMDGAASLYGLSSKGVNLCFLMKAQADATEFSLNGKSSDGKLLTCIMEEAKAAFEASEC